MEAVIPNILQTLGLGIFFYYLIRGLRLKITALEGTISVQNQTLEAMEKRIEETEKVGALYKNLIADLPKDLDNYRAIISRTKDDVILELNTEIQNKQKKLEEAEKQQIMKLGGGQDIVIKT